jgi:hypothetical protein
MFKTKVMNIKTLVIPAIMIAMIFGGCKTKEIQVLPPDTYTYNPGTPGPSIRVEFTKGEAHNHPLMAIWVEDMQGNYIQTLYVAESIGKGVFLHGDGSSGKWMPGEIRRPAALPVWSHRRGIMAKDGLYLPTLENPVPDDYTGPTPPQNFIIESKLERTDLRQFMVFFEINQSWDWNEFWTNNKYPDSKEYKTSCQPALVYKTIVNLDSGDNEYTMQLIGHSHYAGEDGRIYEDLSTFTTAKKIAKEIKLVLE